MHLEATLAASAISTVAALSDPTASNSPAAQKSPTASAASIPEPAYKFLQGLAIAGVATLLTPAWYLAFPLTIAASSSFALALFSPFVVAAGGSITPSIVGAAIAVGAIGYALLPPALIAGGLVQAGSAVSQALSQPAAATKARAAAAATPSDAAPASTGQSNRGASGGQSNTAARTRSRGSSPKPATNKKAADGPKRTVGGSGRHR
jgi:hypothetical protein